MRVVKGSSAGIYFVYMQTPGMTIDRPADYMIEKREQTWLSAGGWHIVPQWSEASMNVTRTLKEAKADILAYEIRNAEREAHDENNARATETSSPVLNLDDEVSHIDEFPLTDEAHPVGNVVRFSCTDCHEVLQYDDREDCYVDPQGVDVCWDEPSQQYYAHSVWEEIERD